MEQKLGSTPDTGPDVSAGVSGRRLPWKLRVGVALAAVALGSAWLMLRRPDPDRLWVEAERAVNAGRVDEARALLGRIERLRPRAPQDWVLRAQLASAAGKTDDALAALRLVPDGNPLAAQAHLLAGRLERARNRLCPAEAEFRRALEINPDLVDARRELVFIYGMQLRRREADVEFRALSRLTSLNHHDLFTWALTHFSTWRTDVSKDLESFVAADPADRHSRLALLDVLIDQPGTEEKIQRLLEGLPRSDADALAMRVRLSIRLGQISEAGRLLEQGPSDHPKLARLRGKLALLRRDPAAAAAHFQTALSDDPYDRVSTFELGQALRLSGDEAGASVYLGRVKRLNEVYNLITRIQSAERENAAPDLTKLGAASEAAGLIEEARGWYLLAVRKDPLDSAAQKALYSLGHGDDAKAPRREGDQPACDASP